MDIVPAQPMLGFLKTIHLMVGRVNLNALAVCFPCCGTLVSAI
jgi:hypothetical protein